MNHTGSLDLRPPPVLALGVTGHRRIKLHSVEARALEDSIKGLIEGIRAGLATWAGDNSVFQPIAPVVRIVGMAAAGADLIGARAGFQAGAQLANILPFPLDDYLADFTDADAQVVFKEVVTSSQATLELPGTRDEGDRAYERANEAILDQSDLLLAIWDGSPARGRGGTADMIREALNRDLPVIVVDPGHPGTAQLVTAASEKGADLSQMPVHERSSITPDRLAHVIGSAIGPPDRVGARGAINDLVAEPAVSRTWRREFPFLVRLLTAGAHRPQSRIVAADEEWRTAIAQASFGGPSVRQGLEQLQLLANRIDSLADHYGQLHRSSSVDGYLLAVMIAVVSGLIGILFPAASSYTIVIQGAVTALLLFDNVIANKQRWHERWIGYRLLAEQLRILRYSQPYAIALKRASQRIESSSPSWTEWFVRRAARAMGLPNGRLDADVVSAAMARLGRSEIEGQISYHRKTYRQLGVLDRRLRLAANVCLLLGVAVAATAIAVQFIGSSNKLELARFTTVLLSVLPAMLVAFAGIRAQTDAVRLIERSMWSAAALTRLQRRVEEMPASYDNLADATRDTASFIMAEISEWRFVLESRRTRLNRRRAFMGPRSVAAFLRRYRTGPT
jgi:hypothetical protein